MEKTTINHQEIRKWAESVDGKPEMIDQPKAEADKVGIRISIRGNNDKELLSESHPPTHISWDEFFRIFEEQQLVFMYRDTGEAGDLSTWYHFGKRDLIDPGK